MKKSIALASLSCEEAPYFRTFNNGPICFAEKPWLRVLFANLLWEKKHYSFVEIVRLIIEANMAILITK